MSPPISIRDVLAIVGLPTTMPERIRSADEEFRMIGKDVAIAHRVLLGLQHRYATADKRWLRLGPPSSAEHILNIGTIEAVFDYVRTDLENLGRKLDRYSGRVGPGPRNLPGNAAFRGELPKLRKRLEFSFALLLQLELLLQKDELAAGLLEIRNGINEQRAENMRLRRPPRASDSTPDRSGSTRDDAPSSTTATRDAIICRWRSYVAADAAAHASAGNEDHHDPSEQRARDRRHPRARRQSGPTNFRPRPSRDDTTPPSPDPSSSSTLSPEALIRDWQIRMAADAAAADDDALGPESQPTTYYRLSNSDEGAADGGGSGSTSRGTLYSFDILKITWLRSAVATPYLLLHGVFILSTSIMWIVAFGLAAQRTSSAHEFSMVSRGSTLVTNPILLALYCASMLLRRSSSGVFTSYYATIGITIVITIVSLVSASIIMAVYICSELESAWSAVETLNLFAGFFSMIHTVAICECGMQTKQQARGW